MKNVPIKFEIYGLFGEYDVHLPLRNPVSIFLGENGMGKTTILSCLYYVLSAKIEQLSTISFKRIAIFFKNGEQLSLEKKDLVAYIEKYVDDGRRYHYNLDHFISDKEMMSLRKQITLTGVYDSNILEKYIYRFSEIYGVPKRIAEREFIRYLEVYDYEGKSGNSENALAFRDKITNLVGYDILYFPTYRRIEEDMSKLGFALEDDRQRLKGKLIQFGMTDVDAAVKDILSQIKSSAINGFTKMTGLLLKQYLSEEPNIYNTFDNRDIDINKLRISLDRIGDEIAQDDKENIIWSVQNGEIYSQEKSYLRNLINKLIQSYDKQNIYDSRVRNFVKVCNRYLSNKKYYYDESKVEISIYRTDLVGDIDKSKVIYTQALSSGEKQIISIFSKLYLEKSEKCFVLFDEPELSLSIQWQEKFLPDIIRSNKCVQLIAVTHSPFIFDNEFDEYAQDMGECLIWTGR